MAKKMTKKMAKKMTKKMAKKMTKKMAKEETVRRLMSLKGKRNFVHQNFWSLLRKRKKKKSY